jgi:serine kinase of HPr protein (carbohydrate metabolism regulator)
MNCNYVIKITQIYKQMKLSGIIELLNAKLVTSGQGKDIELAYAFASDLMSDVLTLDKSDVLLITGLANTQAIRTAEMSDINTVILARNKRASMEMIALANENGINIVESERSVFHISGELYKNGVRAIF